MNGVVRRPAERARWWEARWWGYRVPSPPAPNPVQPPDWLRLGSSQCALSGLSSPSVDISRGFSWGSQNPLLSATPLQPVFFLHGSVVISHLSSGCAALELARDAADLRYGWGQYCPPFLQRFCSPKWAAFFFCLASLMQGVTINGLLHYFLPMIERRFGLSSTQSGLMSGAYDVASLMCVIPATYLGGRRGSHRPRYIGTGLLVMGTGSLVFSLPAFFGGRYRRGGSLDLCREEPHHNHSKDYDDEYSPTNFWLLFSGNFLHGIGASPLYTLALTYIDDNVPPNQASIYFSCYFMMAVMGPFLGMVGGGFFSQIDGDFLYSSPVQTELEIITPNNPSWVGCWWCGFIISGFCSWLFAIPILGLPKELPEGGKLRAGREKTQGPDTTRMSFSTLSELPRAMLEVIRRLKFDFITIAFCAEAVIFSGMSAFLAKLLHLQFGLNPSEVALYMCIITIPSTLCGIYFGSTMVKMLKMGVKEILFMDLILMLLSAPCAFTIFISCPGQGVAGVSLPYPTSKKGGSSGHFSLEVECNRNCHCDEQNYNPICGADETNYYSACYAGCRIMTQESGHKIYRNCSCIVIDTDSDISGEAGYCAVPCPLFPLFVVLIFLYLFLTFSILIPGVTATLRVVHKEVGSLALGVQWLFGRALGTIPGPIIFGKAIDLSCKRWLLNQCGETGHCLLYDNMELSLNISFLIEGFKLVGVFGFSVALFLSIKDEKHKTREPSASGSSK